MVLKRKEITTSAPKITVKKHILAITALFVCWIAILAIVIITDIILGNFSYEKLDLLILTALTIAIVLGALYFYFMLADKRIIAQTKYICLLSVVLIVCVILTIFVDRTLNSYARPFALFAILVTLLMGRNIGIIANVMFTLIMMFIDIFISDTQTGGVIALEVGQITSIFLSIVIGLGFVFLMAKDAKRLKNLLIGVYLIIPTVIVAGVVEWTCGITGEVLWRSLGWAALSPMLSSVLFMALLPVFEYTFNVTTNFRLIELADHNNELIKMLQKQAPGTYNHSYMVSNLAESCAYAIGENTHLARVVAYYHDIGKLKNPEFFTENQSEGVNPHDNLTPEISVAYLKKHVSYGVKLAQQYKLPVEIVNVIKEHHGTTLIKYFYAKALNFTDGNLSYDEFRYDGPTPRSKISAIMMIVDACEAALRSVDKKDTEKVKSIVDGVVGERINFKQFDDCDITLKELTIIKDTIIKSVVGLYHERVGYPNIILNKENKEENN